LEIWKSGNLEIWEFGNLGIWEFGMHALPRVLQSAGGSPRMPNFKISKFPDFQILSAASAALRPV
jgi:hypothetical protein